MSNATELTSAMAAVERRLKNTKDTAVITRGEFEAISRGLEDLIVFQETTLLNDLAQQASAVERGEIVDLPDSVQDSDGFIEWTRECSKVLNKCPGCGGVADNGHDRSFPEPNPYFCTKCDEEDTVYIPDKYEQARESLRMRREHLDDLRNHKLVIR